MLRAPVRANPALAAAVSATVPGPVRVVGPLSVSHAGVTPTDHVQALPVLTVKGATAPPPLAVVRDVGVTSYVHDPPPPESAG